jgi:hypothetical protein
MIQSGGMGTYERQRNTSRVDLPTGASSEASIMCQGGIRVHRPYDLGLVYGGRRETVPALNGLFVVERVMQLPVARS